MKAKVILKSSSLDRFEAKLLKRPGYRKVHAETALVSKVAARLIVYRAQHKISQAALAKNAGISRKALNEIEGLNQPNPGLKTLAGLAKALHISVPELLS